MTAREDGAAAGSGPNADTPVRFVRGIGPQRAAALAAAGLATAGDLLFHLPSRYDDWRSEQPAAAVRSEGPWTVRGELRDLRVVRTRRRGLALVRAVACDASGGVPVIWFNQPYLANRVVPGTVYRLHGAARPSEGGRWELVNPSLRPVGEGEPPRGLVPVYPPLKGIGPATFARVLPTLLPLLDRAGELPEPLPPSLLARRGLPPLPDALRSLHRPPDGADPLRLLARESPPRARLAYGELLELQLELALLRRRGAEEPKPHRYRIDDAVRAAARAALPFRLTGAQKQVLREIVDDLTRPWAMLRLLQGDVGSGKTIVAALALVVAVESGLQGAFMAPTELLAEQHFGNLSRLLGGRYRLALLSSSRRDPAARAALASGEVQIAVGTHALLQERVDFRNLALAVIDEQHRFGVEQRLALQRKGTRPDLLVMTATPIPRSLALTAYGDLEISCLDELPPGRTPVETEVLPASERRRVYRRLRDELAHGGQAYLVFPLIEGSESVSAEAVEALGREAREYLAPLPSAVLHGRLAAEERERVMREFATGRVRVLVATTVIEVGVDVPEATWMVIESAERFGLAQLHQLRGRIGRGRGRSRCVALHGRLTEAGRRRLAIFAASQDGFRLAEADLELRGPGDVLGLRQSGLPSFRFAHPLLDQAWLERARADAAELLSRWQEPELAPLRARIEPRVATRIGRLAGG